MRISTLHIFNIANNSMADANEALIKTQEQLSTGRRVLKPSDDPVASTKILSISKELAMINQYKKNIDIATSNLSLQEATLNGVTNIIQRIQELAVQAGNTATLSPTEYKAIASEVDTRLDELKNLLNSQNANADYIFGGYKSTVAPFEGSSISGFRYLGDDGQLHIKVAHNTTVPASDSGKSLFVGIDSAQNTIRTSASTANTSDPAAQISVGIVVDQKTYDDFYPEDIVVTFNADTNIVPPGKNFTATERSTGRIIVADQPYTSGEEITINGVSFRISGAPVSGGAATPATRNYGADGVVAYPVDFTPPADETFDITVGGRTETFVVDGPVTNATDFAAILNSAVNGNAGKLANLGVTVDANGFSVASGVNFSISNGTANIDAVTGLNTSGGTSSADGMQAQGGDQFFIDSTNKQDILTTLARFSEAMKSYDGSNEGRDSLGEAIATTIDNLGNAQNNVLEIMAKIGARNNTLESTMNMHLDIELVSQKLISDLRDLDYAEAATRLSTESLILEAAQSSFVRVTRLSLFSHL